MLSMTGCDFVMLPREQCHAPNLLLRSWSLRFGSALAGLLTGAIQLQNDRLHSCKRVFDPMVELVNQQPLQLFCLLRS